MRELKYELERDAEFEEVDRLRKEFSKKHLDDITKTLDEPIDIDDENPRIDTDDKQSKQETTASN